MANVSRLRYPMIENRGSGNVVLREEGPFFVLLRTNISTKNASPLSIYYHHSPYIHIRVTILKYYNKVMQTTTYTMTSFWLPAACEAGAERL